MTTPCIRPLPQGVSHPPPSCGEAQWQGGYVPWLVLLYHIIAQDQSVHLCAQEAIQGLSRPVHVGGR
jgi:hypothetical protein